MFLYNDILTLLRQLLCCLFLSVRFCLTACKGKNNSTICSGVGCGRSKIGSFLFCDLWVGVRASGTWELIPQLSTSLCEKPTSPDVVTVYCCVVVQLCAKKTSRCSKPRTLLPCLHFGQLAAWHSLQPRIRVPSPNLQQCVHSNPCVCQQDGFPLLLSTKLGHMSHKLVMKEARSLTRNFSLHAF